MRLLFFKSIVLTFIFVPINHAFIITFFIRPYLTEFDQTRKKNGTLFDYPGKLTAKILKNKFFTTRQCQGIFATYQGYLTFSDAAGQCTFPKKSTKNTIKLLVTESITPIFMIGNTIHHWQINPLIDARIYSFEKIKDKLTQNSSWRVAEIQLPKNRIIDLDTIVLLVKPKDIFIPTGNFQTTDNTNLILPYIYAKKNLNNIHPALWIIKVRQFFGQISEEIKKESNTYYMKRLAT